MRISSCKLANDGTLLRNAECSACRIKPVLIIIVWKHCLSMAQSLQSDAAYMEKEVVFSIKLNKAKGTLVPERGWKYYILPTKVHPQTSFPEFGPRIHPQNSAPKFGPKIRPQNSVPEFGLRIWPQNSAPEFGPRIRPQNSAPEFGPSSVLGPGTCFKAYNLIQSQDAWLELKNECYKKLVKKFSLPLPLPLPPYY